MPVYSGSFPVVAEGLDVTVRVGATNLTDPDPGVVGSTPADGGGLAFSYTYEDGDDSTVLVGSVSSSLLGTLETSLTFDASATIANGGGGGSDLTPTYVEAGSVQLSTATYTAIPWAESADFDLRADHFTLDGDTLTCIEAGTYRIDVYLLPGPHAPLDTPGPVEVEVAVSVNGGNVGPSWNYYPRLHFYAVTAGQKAAISFSLPQVLAVDDTVEIMAKVFEIGSTDLGDAVVAISPTSGALMLTKLA